MAEIRSLCALCGSREGADTAYRKAAKDLGALIARRGTRLIYGGGAIGLMGVLANSVLSRGGAVVGVIPDFLMKWEVGHAALSDLVITRTMHDRKTRMFEMADGFVVLPGGLGTLDEAFEIITWKQLRLHDKPIVVLDVGGYWGALVALIDHVVASGFASPAVTGLFTVVDSPEKVFPALEVAPASEKGVLSGSL
jgi:uncharacterized protein (TIGR00730 family)